MLTENKALYVSSVLGVSSYLLPERIFAVRKFQGSLPCDILALVMEPPGEKELLLLKKIMEALSIDRFALLEIKDLDYRDWILKKLPEERLAKRFLIFSKEPELPLESDNPLFLRTFPLKELIQQGSETSDEVTAKKRKLWGDLKNWLKENPL